MSDRPINFSAPMVRALLAGRKTQTRRLATSPLARCAPGDRLYVRGHWKTMALHNDLSPTKLGERYRRSIYGRENAAPIRYLADNALRGEWPDEREGGWMPGKHRQGMHMPRWASRLTLLVEAVRGGQLQAVTQADALAEGCVRLKATGRAVFERGDQYLGAAWPTPRAWYADLWDTLHGPEQRWDDDPAVVALTFRVVADNIDRIAA